MLQEVVSGSPGGVVCGGGHKLPQSQEIEACETDLVSRQPRSEKMENKKKTSEHQNPNTFQCKDRL